MLKRGGRMRRIIMIVLIATGTFGMVGWALDNDRKSDRDRGYEHADMKRQGDLENIKRGQGEGGAGRDLHTYVSVEA